MVARWGVSGGLIGFWLVLCILHFFTGPPGMLLLLVIFTSALIAAVAAFFATGGLHDWMLVDVKTTKTGYPIVDCKMVVECSKNVPLVGSD